MRPEEHVAAFGTVDGELEVGGMPLGRLAARVGSTPFFAYDRGLLDARVAALRTALPLGLELSYAMKANPMPAVVQHLAGRVDRIDVASGLELRTALDTTMDPAKISFAGPGKSPDEIRQAVAAGIIVELESATELRRVAAAGDELGLRPRVAVRVNPDFAVKGSGMRMGGGPQQFGVDAEQVPEFLREAAGTGVDILGFHVFAGSQNLNAEIIAEAQRRTVDLVVGLAGHLPGPVRYLNLGGGFGIPYVDRDRPLDLGLNSLVDEHAPRRQALRVTPRIRTVLDPSAVVEASGNLAAEPRDPNTLVEPRLSDGERGQRDRVGHRIQPNRRGAGHCPRFVRSQIIQTRKARYFVIKAIPRGDSRRNLDVTASRHAESHRPQSPSSRLGDGAQENPGVLPASELEDGIRVVVEKPVQRVAQDLGRLSNGLGHVYLASRRRGAPFELKARLGDGGNRPGCQLRHAGEQGPLAKLPPQKRLNREPRLVKATFMGPRHGERGGRHRRGLAAPVPSVVQLPESHRVGDHAGPIVLSDDRRERGKQRHRLTGMLAHHVDELRVTHPRRCRPPDPGKREHESVGRQRCKAPVGEGNRPIVRDSCVGCWLWCTSAGRQKAGQHIPGKHPAQASRGHGAHRSTRNRRNSAESSSRT
jgi:diaminopimelate decarboxylase